VLCSSTGERIVYSTQK